MALNAFARALFAVCVCLALLVWPARPTFAQLLHMSPAQTISPRDLDAEEQEYYKTLTDPVKAKNFIVTRSYVRLAQKVLDHKLPPLEFPQKPDGFSVAYLLPDDPSIINQALGAYLSARITANPALLDALARAAKKHPTSRATNPVNGFWREDGASRFMPGRDGEASHPLDKTIHHALFARLVEMDGQLVAVHGGDVATRLIEHRQNYF